MAVLTDREIKKLFSDTKTRISKLGVAGTRVTDGVPVARQGESDGDLAYDRTSGNLYIFDEGSYKISVDTIFFMYAASVNFTGETASNIQAGIVTSQGDVTGFTSSVFSAAGVPFEFRGTFFGVTASTDPTDYVWSNVGGSVEVNIRSSNGNVLKGSNNTTALKAYVRVGGFLKDDNAHSVYKYKWTYNGNTVCVDSSTREVLNDANGNPLVSANGTTCGTGVPADSTLAIDNIGSALREVVVGKEDVANTIQILCEVSDIN